MGQLVFESVAYFVPGYMGGPGAAAYALPDSTRPGTTTTYDGEGRVIGHTDALSNKTTNTISIVCGAAGTNDPTCYEQTATVDALGHQGLGLVDALERKVYMQKFTGSSGATYAPYATTRYTYDFEDRLVQILHPDAVSKTTFQFNMAGRKTAMSDPDSGSSSYVYDHDGNPLQATDARGVSVFAGYDGLDRPLWRSSTNSPTGAHQTYTYDSTQGGNLGIGHLTNETFSGGPGNSLNGSYSYVYDARSQVTSSTLSVAGSSYTLQSSFNDAGNTLSQTYPNGDLVSHAYTAEGWLSGVTLTQGATSTSLFANADYQGPGGATQHVTSAQLGNGIYGYGVAFDLLLRPTEIKYSRASDSSVLFDQIRGFDAAGNVTTASATLAGGTDNQAFCYDELARLTWAGSAGTPPCGAAVTASTLSAAAYTHSFSYDNLGRLTSSPVGTYSYGDSAHLHAATAIGGSYTATYDAAGNMSCRADNATKTCAGGSPSGATMAYDSEGTLNTWQDPQSSVSDSFLYDNQGDRVEQQTTSAAGTSTTVYVGNIEQVTSGPSGTTTSTFYYAGSMRIAASVNGPSYLGADALGSTNLALDNSGAVTAAVLYGPYGSARYSSGTMPTDYGFTGQRHDSVTGLDYFNARYYDPVAGQFTSADTILPGDGYDILGLSRYAYVEGNPIARTDPSGHCPWCIGAIVGAVVGAGISYGSQVVGNLQRGQSLGSALTNVDVAEIGKAALVGALIGATGGAALAVLGGGFAAGAVSWAAASGIGQVADNVLHGRQWHQDVLGAAVFGAAVAGARGCGGGPG